MFYSDTSNFGYAHSVKPILTYSDVKHMDSADNRPLITLAIFAYNQKHLVAEAVKGALSQTYSPLEIIISDDCSTDGTLEVIKKSIYQYKGPHEVIVRCNDSNLGISGHINEVMKSARGELLVAAAGDDISFPDRVQRTVDAYLESNKKAYSIYGKALLIDEKGMSMRKVIPDTPRDLSLNYFGKRVRFVEGSTHAWHRDIFDIFGPMDTKVVSEDVVIPFRALLLGSISFIDKPLILRRFHNKNISRPSESLDVSERIEWYKRYDSVAIESFYGILKTRLNDITMAKLLLPSNAQKLDEIYIWCLHRIIDLTFEKSFKNTNIRGRIITACLALKQGTPPIRIVRWLAMYHFPYLYYNILPRINRYYDYLSQ
jgi:glycosyltransferase involved in cell wall biosynthesis